MRKFRRVQNRRAADRTPAQSRGRRLQQPRRQIGLGTGRAGHLAQVLGQVAGLLDDLLPAILPGVGHGRQHLVEARHALARLGRPISAAIERLQVGRQEDRHRPAAAAGHHLHRVHVNLVQVRPLFAIDLDAHEVLVHPRGDLPDSRSSRAPSRGTSGRPSSRSTRKSAALRLWTARAPRVPRETNPPDCCVLQQVRAGLVGQSVGHRQAYSLKVCSGPGNVPDRTSSRNRVTASVIVLFKSA